MSGLTKFSGVTLDCPNPAQLADFYHQLTGLNVSYSTDDYTALGGGGDAAIGFQRVDGYQAPTWPGQDVPQQFHLDFSVEDMAAAEEWVLQLGATKAAEQPGGERWRVYLDPAGHPFCLAMAR